MTNEMFTKPWLFLSIHSSESQQEFFRMLDEKIEKVCDVVSLILMVRGFLGKSLKAKVWFGFYVYTRLGYV